MAKKKVGASPREFDVVIATDLRLPGGNSSSTAEEIIAQAAAGYRTGLLHVPSQIVMVGREFSPRYIEAVRAGRAELLLRGTPISTKLLVVRHPTVLPNLNPVNYPIDADHRVVIVNQIAQVGERIVYEPEIIGPQFVERYGPAVWAPISPMTREDMAPYADYITLADDDWFNIIDVDEWYLPRERARTPPVIGRHGRDHELKWPSDRDEILAAYPAYDEFKVRILGGAEIVRRVVGDVPPGWDVLPYAVDGPRDFLKSIDFFVYFHHPDLVEAFGRTIFESLASGAVAIIPAEYESLFGDACVYAEPHQVQDIVRALSRDEARYREQSLKGVRFARGKFGHEIHRARIKELIGPPEAGRRPATTPDRPQATRPRVLLISSDDDGLASLRRVASIGRQLSSRFQPIILTQSQAIDLAIGEGIPVEYLVSERYLGGGHRNLYWDQLFGYRLQQLVALYQPVGLVFDGPEPHPGLMRTLNAHPGVSSAWLRFGDSHSGEGGDLTSAYERRFDVVIQGQELPGVDFLVAADRSIDGDVAATDPFENAIAMGPLALTTDHPLSRTRARAALGLSSSRPAVLVQLDPRELSEPEVIMNVVMATLAENAQLQIRVVRSGATVPSDVVSQDSWVDVYPVAKYLKAFDFVISNAEYMRFHELMELRIPSMFVLDSESSGHLHAMRARYAEFLGAALIADDEDLEVLQDKVRNLMQSDVRDGIRHALTQVRVEPGDTAEAVRAIEDVIDGKNRKSA